MTVKLSFNRPLEQTTVNQGWDAWDDHPQCCFCCFDDICATKPVAGNQELDKDMPMSECIGVACLPESADTTGMECSITGWGTLMSSGS